jgi:hypothetical protein
MRKGNEQLISTALYNINGYVPWFDLSYTLLKIIQLRDFRIKSLNYVQGDPQDTQYKTLIPALNAWIYLTASRNMLSWRRQLIDS